jgi:L-cysteate sulfo-lyase
MLQRPLMLAALPTPLYRMQKLSEETGADLWVKRDDLTGFAMGGNKARKAEFLLADALAQGADAVLTAGAAQSNHCRVIAAAARRFGLECRLFLSGPPPAQLTGNLLLDHLAEARLHFVAASSGRAAAMEAGAEELRAGGRKPYVIPIGGSNAVGARGYVLAMQEIKEQLGALSPKPTRLVFASSSGGTCAGLWVGSFLDGPDVGLLGIRVDRDPDPERHINDIALALGEQLGMKGSIMLPPGTLNDEFVGEDYGAPTEEGTAALRLAWQTEGLLLDPVYTGKAMAGLLALVRRGEFREERVLFLHTGGEPSVFAISLPGFCNAER